MSDEDLYYNIDVVSGKTTTNKEFLVTPSTNDLPNIRWGKSDYRVNSIRVQTSSTHATAYYLVVVCRSGSAEIYFCIPLQPSGSPANSGLDNLLTALGSPDKDAQLNLNTYLTDQTADVYATKWIVLSKPVAVSTAESVLGTVRQTKSNVPMDKPPTTSSIQLHHQEMDWMIDCELVGEEGEKTVKAPGEMGINDMNSMTFAIIMITVAVAFIYMFLPSYLTARYGNIFVAETMRIGNAQQFAELKFHVGIGTILSVIVLSVWGFVSKNVVLATLGTFALIAIVTASSFATQKWTESTDKALNTSAVWRGPNVLLEFVFFAGSIIFASISNNKESWIFPTFSVSFGLLVLFVLFGYRGTTTVHAT
jgi:hypothetical protein